MSSGGGNLEVLFHEACQLDPDRLDSVEGGLSDTERDLLRRWLQADRQLCESGNTFLTPLFADAGHWKSDAESSPVSLQSTVVSDQVSGTPQIPQQIGAYRILNKIAEHGQGTVYRADHPHLNRQVVIKVSKHALNEALQQSLVEEGRSLAALSHPNLAQVFDLQFENGHPYLVMEYIEGRNLAERLREGPLNTPAVVELMRTVAGAMQTAHDVGVIHRDLKPANIVIRAADGVPKVIDFGLARVQSAYSVDEASSQYGGTIAYMPPEQARLLMARNENDTTDARSDVFALGAILYEMLTRQRLYQFTSRSEGLQQAADCRIDFSRLDAAGVSASLRRACQKALAARPEDRFSSASDFAAALAPAGLSRLSLSAGTLSCSLSLTIAAACLGFAVYLGNPGGGDTATRPATPGLDGETGSRIPPIVKYTHHDNDHSEPGFATFSGQATENDDFQIHAVFSAPVYCFLIALNPDRSVQLCYPASPADIQEEPVAELLFPEDTSLGFGFTDGPGQQAFVLVSSSEPLPSFEEWSGSAGNLQDALEGVTGYWRWEDSKLISGERGTRGDLRPLSGQEKFSDLCRRIEGMADTLQVTAVTFPVAPGEQE